MGIALNTLKYFKMGKGILMVFILCLTCMGNASSDEFPQSKAGEIIAVLDVDTSYELKKEQADTISDAMRDEITKTGKYQALDRNKINKLLSGRKCQITAYNKECFIELGHLMGVNKIITGNAAFYNGIYYFSFLIIDASTGKMENIVEDSCKGNDKVITTAGKITSKLLLRYITLLKQEFPKNHKETVEFFLESLESPDRDEWQKPEIVIDHLPIKAGNAIADIGAGSGYFTVLLSRKTGENGTVYAVDIEKEMVEHIKNRAIKEGLNNIKTVLSKPEDPSLQKDTLDLVFLCESYSYLHDINNYLRILRETLKKDGKLAVIDHQQPDIPLTPPYVENVRAVAVEAYKNLFLPAGPMREKVIKEVLKAGFKLDKEYDFLPSQYFLIFSKAE